MRPIGQHDAGMEAIAVRDDGSIIACGRDGRVVALGATTETLLTRPPNARARAVAVARDTILLGTVNGRVLRLRDGVVDEPYGSFDDGHGGVGSVASDGTLVAIGAGLTRFAIHTLEGARIWRGSTYKWPYVVRFSPFARRVACATWQPDLHVVDLDALPPEGDLYGSYPGAGPVFDLAFLADGRIVTVGATEDGGFVRVDERELSTEEGMHAVVVLGDRIVVGGNDQRLTSYDFDLNARGSVVLGEPWTTRGDELPSHAPFHSASGEGAVVALARRGDAVVCATHGGRVLEWRPLDEAG